MNEKAESTWAPPLFLVFLLLFPSIIQELAEFHQTSLDNSTHLQLFFVLGHHRWRNY